ncbi:hypothetical protein IU453_29000 [Nocardia cyriacigeorgica]|uniref:hypothetical protein n=1 Tax=Nocardia cyriacigeorgica TaxID=135487 RepID=UPI0018959F01|nr:hypothetical protein [Nocardia cyriacigeorgica]MBF6320784.1 hypothetical protein [Nocardia cyriacigeorgica]MBF6346676.1 hypothetical protein [Nocardia cyriacigeorgica]MBF6535178.1 hypothetical protein [Nocardia cyriacigeorgica]
MHIDDRTRAFMAEDRKTMSEPARVFLDRWLADMGSALEQWRRSYLPAGFPFDFTLDSLDALEPVVLARYPDVAGIEDDAEFATGTVRYIGEVLVRMAPARWGYQDRAGDDRNPYNRTVVVRANVSGEFPVGVVPEFFVRRLLRDREPGILRGCVVPLLDACAESGSDQPPGPQAPAGSVPDWCAFFSPDEYRWFAGAVDSALGAFGADGQSVDAGYVSVAAGDPDPELHEVDITGLAELCRRSDIEDWPVLCFRAVDDFSTARPHRDWLTDATFSQVEHLLTPWVAAEPELLFEAEPGFPEQPFSMRLDDGTYLHFLATVSVSEGPEVTTFVPRSAIQAWNMPVEVLVRWGLERI